MHKLDKYLEDLEKRINIEQEIKLYNDHKKFCDSKWEEEYFSPKREIKAPQYMEWPDININDAIVDDELMLIREFAMGSSHISTNSGKLMCVRSNYGVGILPSLFGVQKFIMPYGTNTLPNVHPLAGGIEEIKRVVAQGVPYLDSGWGEKVFKIGHRYMEIKNKYPKINQALQIDHPDCQGPMDVCELLWGSGLFYAFYDAPELIHQFLRLITDTYKAFLDKWYTIVPKSGYNVTWGSMLKGSIMLRDDSAMNLPPEIYMEYIYPYNDEILNYFGGGGIHYCGKGDHFVPEMTKMKKLYVVNLSQPHLNNMETIYKSTIDKGILIMALEKETIDRAMAEGRPLKGLVSTI